MNTVTSLAIPGAVEFAAVRGQPGREGVLHLQPHRRGGAGHAEEPREVRLSDRRQVDTVLMRASSRTGAPPRARAAPTSRRATASCSTSGDNFGDFVDESRGTEAERLKVLEGHKASLGPRVDHARQPDLRLVRVRAVQARLQAVQRRPSARPSAACSTPGRAPEEPIMTVEFGVLIPTREAIMSGRPETGPLLAMAERAEAAGFDSVWIGDSITARPRHEPLTLLAAVAARTRRVRLGTGVLLPALRNPVVLAHVVGTLDRVAEGRVILGVGIAADTPAIRKEFAARRACRGTVASGASSRRSRSAGPCGAATASASAASTSRSRTSRWSRSRTAPAGRRSGSAAAARRRSARPRASTHGFPPGPAWSSSPSTSRASRPRRARRAAPAGAVTGAAYVTLALDPNRAAAEARMDRFLETYYAAPARVILARQAGYAGPLEGCVEWIQRWIDAGARHLACASPAATSSPRSTKSPRGYCRASRDRPNHPTSSLGRRRRERAYLRGLGAPGAPARLACRRKSLRARLASGPPSPKGGWVVAS